MTAPTAMVWRNWAGTARCRPERIVRPRSEDHIAELLQTADAAGHPVRAVGTGHSFNRLATTDGTLLDLTALRGVQAVDRAGGTVTVWGGTTVRELNRELAVRGLALENLGTIAEQTVAGATATGNHGTGVRFGPLSTLVVRLRLITPDGEIHTVDRDRDPEVFQAAVTSLGTLGVVSSLTVRTRPAFNLVVTRRRLPLADFLDGFDELAASARHVAFSWSPWRDVVGMQAMDITDEPPGRGGRFRPWVTTADEIRAGATAVAAGYWPSGVPLLANLPFPLKHPDRYVVRSDDGFCFPQPVRYAALEHALPLESTAEAVRAIGAVLRSAGHWSPYSVLVRTGAADDAFLSPAHGRATGYLNLTVPRGSGYAELHRLIEPPLRELQGRPHWGKAHTATAADLRPLYPHWHKFSAIRQKIDPRSTMLNHYLRRVLGD